MKPEGWSEVPLGDILDLSSGKRPELTDGGAIPVFGGNGPMGSTTTSLIDEPTIVIGRVGSPGTTHRTRGPAWVSDNALYVTDLLKDTSLDFLQPLLEFVGLEQYATSSSHPSLSQRRIFSVQVPWPPRDEQRKIAAILSSVEDRIVTGHRAAQQARRVRQGLLRELMTAGCGHSQFRTTRIGQIPEQWSLSRAADLCKKISVGIVVRPASLYVDDGVPCIRSGNISKNGIVDDEWVYISEDSSRQHSKSILHSGDVVVVRSGDPGTACVVPEWLDKCNCIDVIFARPRQDRLDPQFFSLFLNSFAGRKQVVEKRGGLAQKHLNVGALKQVQVPVPSLEEQQLIVERVGAVVDVEKASLAELDRLKRLRSGLMQEIFTGRVRLPAA